MRFKLSSVHLLHLSLSFLQIILSCGKNLKFSFTLIDTELYCSFLLLLKQDVSRNPVCCFACAFQIITWILKSFQDFLSFFQSAASKRCHLSVSLCRGETNHVRPLSEQPLNIQSELSKAPVKINCQNYIITAALNETRPQHLFQPQLHLFLLLGEKCKLGYILFCAILWIAK